MRGTIRFHRNRTQDPFQGEGMVESIRIGSSAEIDRFRKRFQNEKLLDFALFYANHVSSVSDVCQDQRARGLGSVHPIRNQFLPRASLHGPRLMAPQAALRVPVWQF